MVIGLMTTRALGPAGWGTFGTLIGRLKGMLRVAVPPRTAGANTMVSASGTALARSIASRRLPSLPSLRLVTVKVVGTVRSSRASTVGRTRRQLDESLAGRTELKRIKRNIEDSLARDGPRASVRPATVVSSPSIQ